MANIILHHYMPQRTTLSHCHHYLRPRKHNKELIPKTRTLNNKDFIVRMLYKDMYQAQSLNSRLIVLHCILTLFSYLVLCTLRLTTFLINEYYYQQQFNFPSHFLSCIDCVCCLFCFTVFSGKFAWRNLAMLSALLSLRTLCGIVTHLVTHLVRPRQQGFQHQEAQG